MEGFLKLPYPDKVKNGLSSNEQPELHSLKSKPTSAGAQLTKKKVQPHHQNFQALLFKRKLNTSLGK